MSLASQSPATCIPHSLFIFPDHLSFFSFLSSFRYSFFLHFFPFSFNCLRSSLQIRIFFQENVYLFLSKLPSTFSQVAMVEIQLEEEIPEGLLIAFSVMTTVLISVHVFALMISVCILPNIESVSAVQQFVPRARIRDSPHEHLHFYIEMAWIFSTGLGTLLFLAEIAILCWVKFYEFSTKAAIAASAVLVPVCIVFVLFAVHFYRSLAKHNCERSSHDIEELQQLANQLNTATSTPAPSPPMVSHHRV